MAYIFEKYTSGGGSGGGSGIIDVTELPTTADEGAVYRVTKESAEPWVSIDSNTMTLTDFFAGANITFNTAVVDTLPQEMTPPDMVNFIMYVYVMKETGIGWTSEDGTPESAITIGTLFDFSDNGWSNDITAETADGLYFVLTESVTEYYVRLDDKWIPITNNERLTFTLSEDGSHYIVSATSPGLAFGIVNIPATYNGLPVSEIAEKGFIGCFGLRELSIPESITQIPAEAFRDCRALLRANENFENVTAIGDSAFYNCSSISEGLFLSCFPNLTDIGEDAFSNCSGMQFNNWEKLVNIGEYAFAGCTSMRLTYMGDGSSEDGLIIPATVKNIGSHAFFQIVADKVIFKGTPDSISNTAFVSTHYLKDIYVPWAEGAVANAPWGADNATIHYNYVEET